jgi:hypothetical protein
MYMTCNVVLTMIYSLYFKLLFDVMFIFSLVKGNQKHLNAVVKGKDKISLVLN